MGRIKVRNKRVNGGKKWRVKGGERGRVNDEKKGEY